MRRNRTFGGPAIRRTLGATRGQLRYLLSLGLPHRRWGDRYRFDLLAVVRWVRRRGIDLAPPERTVRTRREVAEYFHVAVSTVARWLTCSHFPGQAGSRGRRDGCFPIHEIHRWLLFR